MELYPSLLVTHSVVRFLVLILLVVVVIRSFMGYSGKKEYGSLDNMMGLSLFSVTHTQLLLGLVLYFTSPNVVFGGGSMKDSVIRYWTAEHITMMLIAIVLITLARIKSKKLADQVARHKTMLIYNGIALVIILGAIAMSKRGWFSVTSI